MGHDVVQIFQTILILPALGIVAGVTAGIVKMILNFQERKTEIKTQASGNGSESLRGEIEALRQEVGLLRDTSTQYDISIQHTLEDLQRRVDRMESRKNSASSPEPEQRQQIVLGDRPG